MTSLTDWPTPDGGTGLAVLLAVGNTISMIGWVSDPDTVPELLEMVAHEMREIKAERADDEQDRGNGRAG